MRFIRSRLIITPPVVIVPPTSPVLPLTGTMATPCAAAILTQAETSAVEPGRTTASGAP